MASHNMLLTGVRERLTVDSQSTRKRALSDTAESSPSKRTCPSTEFGEVGPPAPHKPEAPETGEAQSFLVVSHCPPLTLSPPTAKQWECHPLRVPKSIVLHFLRPLRQIRVALRLHSPFCPTLLPENVAYVMTHLERTEKSVWLASAFIRIVRVAWPSGLSIPRPHALHAVS